MTYTTLAFVQTAANFARNATEEYSLGGGYPVTRYNKLTYGIVDNAGNATTATVNNFSSPSSVAGPDLISGRVAITGSTKLVLRTVGQFMDCVSEALQRHAPATVRAEQSAAAVVS